jgi:hypothetical protein
MKQILLLFALIGLVLSSCTSEETSSDETPSLPPDCLVVTVRDFIDGEKDDTRHYTHDSQGRVVRVDYEAGNLTRFLTFSYEANKIIIGGAPFGNATYEYELDDKGRIVKYSSVTISGEATFSYNQEGYLAEMHYLEWPYSARTTFSYVSGNLHTVTERESVNSEPERVMKTHILEYIEERADYNNSYLTPLHSLGFSHSVLGNYFGKASKNLIGKHVVSQPGTTDATRINSYIKDGKGRITLVRSLLPSNAVLEKTITYTCK